MTYSPEQIINKTLIAATPVPIRRAANDSAPVVYTVAAGQPVGTVYSFLQAGPGRSSLYWMFYDANRRPYYARHEKGSFSLSALREQGTLTVKQEVEAATQAAQTWGDWMKKYAVTALWIFAGAVVLKAAAPELIKKIR